MNFAEKLKKIRTYKNFTQEEVAEKLNISHQAYSKIERGETKIDFQRLEQIAKVFDMSLDDIYKLDDNFMITNSTIPNNKENMLVNYSSNEQTISFMEKMLTDQKAEIQFLREQIAILHKILSDRK